MSASLSLTVAELDEILTFLGLQESLSTTLQSAVSKLLALALALAQDPLSPLPVLWLPTSLL
jgi:hypothetical protein